MAKENLRGIDTIVENIQDKLHKKMVEVQKKKCIILNKYSEMIDQNLCIINGLESIVTNKITEIRADKQQANGHINTKDNNIAPSDTDRDLPAPSLQTSDNHRKDAFMSGIIKLISMIHDLARLKQISEAEYKGIVTRSLEAAQRLDNLHGPPDTKILEALEKEDQQRVQPQEVKQQDEE